MSDRDIPTPSLDELADDMRAVMDTAGIERAHILGPSEGGPISIVFAATFPQRTAGLILMATASTLCRGAIIRGSGRRHPNGCDGSWAAGARRSPQRWNCSAHRRRMPTANGIRTTSGQCASPSSIRRVFRMVGQIDVRPFLPLVHAPTLVIHRRGDRLVPVEAAQYLPSHIPQAALRVLDGDDHFPHPGDQESWLAELREFMTGSRAETEPRQRAAPQEIELGQLAAKILGRAGAAPTPAGHGATHPAARGQTVLCAPCQEILGRNWQPS